MVIVKSCQIQAQTHTTIQDTSAWSCNFLPPKKQLFEVLWPVHQAARHYSPLRLEVSLHLYTNSLSAKKLAQKKPFPTSKFYILILPHNRVHEDTIRHMIATCTPHDFAAGKSMKIPQADHGAKAANDIKIDTYRSLENQLG